MGGVDGWGGAGRWLEWLELGGGGGWGGGGVHNQLHIQIKHDSFIYFKAPFQDGKTLRTGLLIGGTAK